MWTTFLPLFTDFVGTLLFRFQNKYSWDEKFSLPVLFSSTCIVNTPFTCNLDSAKWVDY